MIATTIDYQKLQHWRPKRLYCCFRLSVVVVIARGQFLRAWRGRKPQICRWHCHPLCHSSRDINTSGLRLTATLPSPVVGHCRNHLATLFGLAMVENPGLAVGISTLSVAVPVV